MSRVTIRLTRTRVALALMLLLPASVATAQTPVPTPSPTPSPAIAPLKAAPLPVFVVDVRGGFATFGTDTSTSADLGVAAADMPSRGKTIAVGVHLFVLRHGRFKLGIGGEALKGSSSNQRLDSTGKGTGPIIRRQLEGASGQLSLNFGNGKGWSYVTVGGGPMRFESYLNEAKPSRAGTTTLNYGGGARWSIKSHLAFTVDLRFYLTKPADATFDAPARERKRITLLSAGFSIK